MTKHTWLPAASFVLMIGTAVTARAAPDLQPVWSGQYRYWKDPSQATWAFPVQQPNWYDWFIGADTSWTFWQPIYEFPQTHEIRYLGFKTDGQQILWSYSTQDYWKPFDPCDLSYFRTFLAESQQQYRQYGQSDFQPYYFSKLYKAQVLYNACVATERRRTPEPTGERP